MTLTLDPPIRWADQEFAEISLAEPTVEEWEKASNIGQPIASNILLISLVATRISGKPVSETVVRKMKRGDLIRAVDFFDSATAATSKPPGTDTGSS